MRGLLYWLQQLPTRRFLIPRWADAVLVTSEPDRDRLIAWGVEARRIIVARGGVDLSIAEKVSDPPAKQKQYEAVFIGRFHPQKGVLELLEIWRRVCTKRPRARLALIGVGELEGTIRRRITELGLVNKVDVLGFLDGIPKVQVFKASRVVVHPAIYDSGGMAACEAMACGLPGISFDLEALRTYYPRGMLKTPCFDLDAFAENILLLLENTEVYSRLRAEALSWAREWDWDTRAKEVLAALSPLVDHE